MSVRSMEGRLLCASVPMGRMDSRPRTHGLSHSLSFVHLHRKRPGRNLQLRLRDGDLPLECGLRLALRVRLHVRLTGVAVVEGTI